MILLNFGTELLKPTTVIAFIVGYVAFQQWRTNKRRLDLALFDRRFKVWETILKAKSLVSRSKQEYFHTAAELPRRISAEDIAEIVIGVSAVNFLFGDEVCDHVRDMLLELNEVKETGSTANYNKWLDENQDHLRKLFKRKMDFRKL